MRERSFVVGVYSECIAVHDTLENSIEEYAVANKLQKETLHFDRIDALMLNESRLDILFWDLDSAAYEKEYMESGLQYETKGYRMIAMSVHEEHYREAFKMGAFRFALYPIKREDLFEMVTEAYRSLIGNGEVEVHREGTLLRIAQR